MADIPVHLVLSKGETNLFGSIYPIAPTRPTRVERNEREAPVAWLR